MTDDPCDDWANHIGRRWVPMLDKRTRAERRAGGEPELVRMTPEQLDELIPKHWTLDRYISNPKIVIDPKRERMTDGKA